jgi:peptide-methionine (S)-S-oxide reductase
LADSRQATFGGGCFWCLEAVFERLRGVEAVESGYAGGARPNPSYQQVCSGATGHAEVIRVKFDPEIIGFGDLLEVFFAFHDPTTANRQGPDIGSQYRSIILYESPEQRSVAATIIARLTRDRVFEAPIVTELLALDRFWPAEAGHRQYFQRNSEQAYCRSVIAPKVAKLRAEHAHRLRS